jgi:hypothetical protein
MSVGSVWGPEGAPDSAEGFGEGRDSGGKGKARLLPFKRKKKRGPAGPPLCSTLSDLS